MYAPLLTAPLLTAPLALTPARSRRSVCPSQVKLVNINIPDVMDGKPSIVLGLVWTIILQYHVSLRRFSSHEGVRWSPDLVLVPVPVPRCC